MEEIKEFDGKIDAINAAFEEETLALPERERLASEQQELKAKLAEIVKSLRLKDRHIEKISHRLKELSMKVERVMEEITDLEQETGFTAEELSAMFAQIEKNKADEKKFLKKLGLPLEEAQKLEKQLRSVDRKLKKIEQESGFHARELPVQSMPSRMARAKLSMPNPSWSRPT